MISLLENNCILIVAVLVFTIAKISGLAIIMLIVGLILAIVGKYINN